MPATMDSESIELSVISISMAASGNLAGSDGRQISTAQAHSSSYAGADVGRMALTLVSENADEVVAKLYADYCTNAGLGGGRTGGVVPRYGSILMSSKYAVPNPVSAIRTR